MKTAFIQCPAPLLRAGMQAEAELVPPQGHGAAGWHCCALGGEGKLQKQRGGQEPMNTKQTGRAA